MEVFDLGRAYSDAARIKALEAETADRSRRTDLYEKAVTQKKEPTIEETLLRLKAFNGAARAVVAAPERAQEIVETYKRHGVLDPNFAIPPGLTLEQIKQEAARMVEESTMILSQYDKPQKRDVRNVGGSLVEVPEEGEPQVLYTEPEKPKTPEAVNSQLVTRPTGNGMVQDFAFNPRTNQMAPVGEPYKAPTKDGGQVTVGPDGQLIVDPGKTTEGEKTSANYAGRMDAAEKLLGDYVPSTKDYMAARMVMQGGPITASAANAALSTEGQQYYQAAADWVRAKLRKESGAVIAAEEMEQEIKTYFPLPNDSPATVAQKRQARQQAMAGMRQMGGRAMTPSSQSAPGTSKRLKFDSNGNQVP